MTKHMTPRALAANRANAQRSTGRRTPEGKARSSQNAVTHGLLARRLAPQPPDRDSQGTQDPSVGLQLLARAAIPPSLERYEDPAEFAAVVADFHRQFAPVGPLELFFVNTIAACAWRLDRLLRAESGAIAQAREHAAAANTARADLVQVLSQDSAAIQDALDSGDPEALRLALDPDGIFPGCDGANSVSLGMAHDQINRNHADLTYEVGRDPQSALDRAAVPASGVALRYARYEAHLSRQLHRALNTLRTLQRERRRASDGPAAPESPPDPAPPPGASAPADPPDPPSPSAKRASARQWADGRPKRAATREAFCGRGAPRYGAILRGPTGRLRVASPAPRKRLLLRPLGARPTSPWRALLRPLGARPTSPWRALLRPLGARQRLRTRPPKTPNEPIPAPSPPARPPPRRPVHGSRITHLLTHHPQPSLPVGGRLATPLT